MLANINKRIEETIKGTFDSEQCQRIFNLEKVLYREQKAMAPTSIELLNSDILCFISIHGTELSAVRSRFSKRVLRSSGQRVEEYLRKRPELFIVSQLGTTKKLVLPNPSCFNMI
jgi:hypothetical protein